MYGIYNVEILEKQINTVHNIHTTTPSHERLFVGQQSSLTLRSLYANSIRFTSLLHKFTVIFENSARQMYCTIQGINHPAMYICISNQNFNKRILANFTVTPSKLRDIFNEVKTGQLTQIMIW